MPKKDDDTEPPYSQMPFIYRLIMKFLLKLPNPSIPFFIIKRFPMLEGIYYGILLPIFVFISGALTLWLYPTATAKFGFPLNILAVLLLPTAVFIIFVRMQLHRTMSFWKSIHNQPKEWETSKNVAELIELFQKERNNKSKNE